MKRTPPTSHIARPIQIRLHLHAASRARICTLFIPRADRPHGRRTRKGPAIMLRRRIAHLLLSLAFILAGPIALSFLPDTSLHCPAPERYPPGRTGAGVRLLRMGVLFQDRCLDSPEMSTTWASASHSPASPFELDWSRTENRTRRSLPVWPLPPLLVVAGVFVLRRGSAAARERRVYAALKRRTRIVYILGTASGLLGLAAAALVLITLPSRGGLTGSRAPTTDEASKKLLSWSLSRGSANLQTNNYLKFDGLTFVQTPAPAPRLTIGWRRSAAGWAIRLPVWPSLACILVRDTERRTGR